ncbi:MAG: hypothetical protein LBV02_04660 [Bacteroidales bacterium]|jgi:hypothetical protein|nr:hypothetical protein [Bacteroidales bacterium]
MLQQIFRCLLLVGIGIVVVYVSDLDNKFPIMIGWTAGAVLAFIAGNTVLKYKTRKDTDGRGKKG